MGALLQQVRVIGPAAQAVSADTRNGDAECRAYLPHALIAEAARSLRECSEGDTFGRVEVHR